MPQQPKLLGEEHDVVYITGIWGFVPESVSLYKKSMRCAENLSSIRNRIQIVWAKTSLTHRFSEETTREREDVGSGTSAASGREANWLLFAVDSSVSQ